jgi:hypothetical protein
MMSRRWLDRLLVACAAGLILASVLVPAFVQYGWQAITFPYPLDYGEGPILDQVARLAYGQTIYRADLGTPPYTVSNYPPFYMLLQAPVLRLVGPAFWYGRLLSWLSIVAAAIFVALILYTLTHDGPAALVGGLTLPAIPYVAVWAPLCRVDALALAMSLGALLAVVRWPGTRWGLTLTALLLTAAIYTRQSYALAAPLATFVWLLSRYGHRRALALAALVGGLSLGLFLALTALTHGGFYVNIILANLNDYRLDTLKRYLKDLWTDVPYLLVGSGLYAALAVWLRMRSWPLLVPYLAGAALAALTAGKIGSNINYLFELAAALSLATGALIAWQRPRPLLRYGLLLLLVAQLALLGADMRHHRYAQAKLERRADFAALAQVVHQADGVVLADEEMGLVPLDGRPLFFQPFEFTQLARAGHWDQAPFLEALDQQQFAVILMVQLREFPLHRERWTPEMLELIERRYQTVETIGNTVIYRPRE